MVNTEKMLVLEREFDTSWLTFREWLIRRVHLEFRWADPAAAL